MLFSMNCEAGNVVFLWHGDTEQQYNYVDVVVVVSGMQFLRLRSTIRRHHHPQRAVLSQICCFGEHKVVVSQILLDGAEPRDAGMSWLSSPVRQRGG